jgi:hypothetical protein
MKEAIYDRISVRTYVKKPLLKMETEALQKLIDEMKNLTGPFGHKVRYFVDHQQKNLDDEAKRIGTYGFIKNAPSFVGAVVKNEFTGMIDFGYLFEHFILLLTKRGYGTCWLAGTFDRSAFDHYVNEGEVIPAITPMGIPEDHMSLRERAIRLAIKANRRKSFEEMFFISDIKHPLTEGKKHPIEDALKLVQLAPSASNKQPWRMIVDEQNVHVYLERTPNYGTGKSFVMQALDIGIAMKHFEVGLQSLNIHYHLIQKPYQAPSTFEYIITYQLDMK